MKHAIKWILPSMVFCTISCSNGNPGESTSAAFANNTETETSAAAKQKTAESIVGEWKRMAYGEDKNNNKVLDDDEVSSKPGLKGFDYYHFMSNGKCTWDKDMKFEGTWEIKEYKKRNSIMVYSKDLPAGLSQEERDKNAIILKIASIESTKITVTPAHLGTTLVVYKRIS
jgi:hypothetical protein